MGYNEDKCRKLDVDKTKMQNEASRFVNTQLPTINEVLDIFDDDIGELASRLASETNTKYKSQRNAIRRWLSGKSHPSKRIERVFKSIVGTSYLNKSNLRVIIAGCVKVSNDYYEKPPTEIIIDAELVPEFLDTALEDNSAGYGFLNGEYMETHDKNDDTFTWLSNVRLVFKFEE